MAIGFVAQGTAAGRSSGTENVTFTPTLPANFSANDFAICLAGTERGVLAVSAGWSSLSANPIANSGDYKMYVFYRTLAAGDSDPTLTMTGLGGVTTGAAARIGTWSAVKPTGQIDAVGATNSGTGTSVSNTGVTTVAKSAVAVAVTISPTNQTPNNDGAFGGVTSTSRINVATGNAGGLGMRAVTLLIDTPAASGSFACTLGTSQAWASLSFSLTPNDQSPTQPKVFGQAVTRAATR